MAKKKTEYEVVGPIVASKNWYALFFEATQEDEIAETDVACVAVACWALVKFSSSKKNTIVGLVPSVAGGLEPADKMEDFHGYICGLDSLESYVETWNNNVEQDRDDDEDEDDDQDEDDEDDA